MPGHAASIGVGRPDVVVDCPPDDNAPLYDGSYQHESVDPAILPFEVVSDYNGAGRNFS